MYTCMYDGKSPWFQVDIFAFLSEIYYSLKFWMFWCHFFETHCIEEVWYQNTHQKLLWKDQWIIPIILRKPSEHDGKSLNYVSKKFQFDNHWCYIHWCYNPTNIQWLSHLFSVQQLWTLFCLDSKHNTHFLGLSASSTQSQLIKSHLFS